MKRYKSWKEKYTRLKRLCSSVNPSEDNIKNINCFQKNPAGDFLKTGAMQGGGAFLATLPLCFDIGLHRGSA